MDSIVDAFRFFDLPKDIRLLVYDYLQPESHLVSIFGNQRCLWYEALMPPTALLLVNRLLCDEIRAYFRTGFPGQSITLVAVEGHGGFALRFLEALSAGHHLDMMSKDNHGDAKMPVELSKFTQLVLTRQLKTRIRRMEQKRSKSTASPLTQFDDTMLQKVYRLCVLRMRKETRFQLRVLSPNEEVERDEGLLYYLLQRVNSRREYHREHIGPFDVTVVFTTTPQPDAIPSPTQLRERYRSHPHDKRDMKLQWEVMTEQELDVRRIGCFYNYRDYQ